MRAPHDMLALLVVTIPSLCHAQSSDLWRAIVSSDLEAVEHFLESGGDPNGAALSPDGNTGKLLRVALFDREEQIAIALLRAGADFESLGEDLALVSREGMREAMAFLLAQNPRRLEHAIASTQGTTFLIAPPAIRGYYDVLELVLTEAMRQGIALDDEAMTGALSAAIRYRQNDAARLLLAYGAVAGETELRAAARYGSPGVVRTLLQGGVRASSKSNDTNLDPLGKPRTALEFAWQRYRSVPDEQDAAQVIMATLVEFGAENETADGALLVPEHLLKAKEPSDARERLIRGARLGLLNEIESLLRDPGFDEATRESAAKIALAAQQNDVARLLIDTGISLNNGVLQAAARGNSPAIVRWLISRGANPNDRKDGGTPIEHWWARYQRRYIGLGGDYVLHELIKAGASVCWLRNYERNLDNVTGTFLRYDAPQCYDNAQ